MGETGRVPANIQCLDVPDTGLQRANGVLCRNSAGTGILGVVEADFMDTNRSKTGYDDGNSLRNSLLDEAVKIAMSR